MAHREPDALIDDLHRLRMQRIAFHVYALGPRALAELLIELDRRAAPGAVMAVLAAFGRLTPPMVRAAGADRMPPRPLRQVQP